MSQPFSRNPVIWLILAASVAAGFGLWAGQRHFAPAGPAAAPMHAAILYPQPRILSPFALVRSDGAAFTHADLRGAWTLAFFGFTHCPDVCPTTLATFAQVDRALGDGAGRPPVAFAFVSVDPERDTPARTGDYAHYFSPKIVALTGEAGELARFTRELGIVYMKSPLANGDYTIDHSAAIVLLDPQGRLRGQFPAPLDANRIVADLERLAGGG